MPGRPRRRAQAARRGRAGPRLRRRRGRPQAPHRSSDASLRGSTARWTLPRPRCRRSTRAPPRGPARRRRSRRRAAPARGTPAATRRAGQTTQRSRGRTRRPAPPGSLVSPARLLDNVRADSMRRLLLIWPRTRDYPIYERLVPTLTIPYLAALTPADWDVAFADDNYGEVRTDQPADLVGISVNTMSAVRAYALADAFRARGVPVLLGGC